MDSIRSLLDRVLKLPPIGQRIIVEKTFVAKYAGVWFPTNEKDDIYLYFLNGLWAMRVCALTFAVHALCYLIKVDFSVFGITVSGNGTVSDLITSFSMITSSVLFFVLYPFFLVRYRWNVNPRTHDVLWYNSSFISAKRRTRWYVLSRSVLGVVVSVTVIKYGYAIILGYPLNLLYSETVFSLIGYMLFLIVTYVIFFQLMSVASIYIWRYLGRLDLIK